MTDTDLYTGRYHFVVWKPSWFSFSLPTANILNVVVVVIVVGVVVVGIVVFTHLSRIKKSTNNF